MQQVLQNIRNGELSVATLPDPVAQPGQVLIANAASLISAGTEKMTRDLARKSLLGKARERPDHVRRVMEKLRNEGFFSTIRQVLEKLDEPMPLGYCSAGVVLACGAGVEIFKPGQKVASNGPHAGIVSVPKHLCAHVPDGVPLDHAAFTVLGAIALQGVRLSRIALGETAYVIGLGLVGQLTVALLKAAGARVIGTDLDPSKCELATKMGAEFSGKDASPDKVLDLTNGIGADAVLITASTKSNGPVEQAAEAVRKKGRVVAVGAVGLELPRRPFYFKEAEFVVSCSYGPGRYDSAYEEQGHDYPLAHVRWTEQRNMEAVIAMMASGKLDMAPLISHRFDIEKAEQAYGLIEQNSEPYLGIILQYPEVAPTELSRSIKLRAEATGGPIGFACLGAGNFARMTLLPALDKVPSFKPLYLCSANGISSDKTGSKFGFASIGTDEAEAFGRGDVKAVFILTRHNLHAGQVVKGIAGGKHVFVEKPLALDIEGLVRVEHALRTAGEKAPFLMVGFNRRFSPAARKLRSFLATSTAPLTIQIRFNAGAVEDGHWVQDPEVGGGRIIGEACHGIDLATYLAGSPVVRVFAESIGDKSGVSDDQCFITLRHANGSISSVAYLAGGDKAFPKERVEVMGGGRVGVIDDFKSVTFCENGRTRTEKLGGQDKGHRGELEAFAQAIASGGEAPISWTDLRSVTLASIFAVRSLREGVPLDFA